MSETLSNDKQNPRKISAQETEDFQREGFDGHVYVGSEAGLGFTMLTVDVHGSHPRKRMLGDTIRTYYVIEGEGQFTVGDTTNVVSIGDYFIIPPGGEYEYSGSMRLVEVNISPSNDFKDQKL